MGFKDRKRDDHGHVIGNDEVDGQKCQHVNGGNNNRENKPNENKPSKLAKELGLSIKNEDDKKELALQLKSRGIAYDMSDAYNMIDEINSEAFDDDYEEEFKETEDNRTEKIANDIGEYFNEAQINELKKYCDRFDVDFDRAKIELAKRFDKMQKDAGYNGVDAADAALEVLEDDIVMGELDGNNEMANAELENAIKAADGDVLDKQFGKDTPERKLAGAMKQPEQLGTPGDFAKKTAKMPNGKEMSLFDFAHSIVNYLDTDTASAIIAAKYGVSESDAKAYLESPYNREGSKEDYERKLKNSRG